MLTPQEMARIEEDERKRHAEEQYRAEIRAKLQDSGAQSPPIPVEASPPRSNLKLLSGILAALVIVIALIMIFSHLAVVDVSNNSSFATNPGPVRPSIRYVPTSDNIASGEITVPHGGYVSYKITISADMYNPIVSGDFITSGGSGNDIQAVITGESEYTNWINGHEAGVFWGTHGRETTGMFNVKLKPGTYYLAFSNRFSPLSDKSVSLKVTLNYQRRVVDYGHVTMPLNRPTLDYPTVPGGYVNPGDTELPSPGAYGRAVSDSINKQNH